MFFYEYIMNSNKNMVTTNLALETSKHKTKGATLRNISQKVENSAFHVLEYT